MRSMISAFRENQYRIKIFHKKLDDVIALNISNWRLIYPYVELHLSINTKYCKLFI